jgi:UDP-N-acetylglucosamine--N-acetylmuramyl-(pentapeptide) pyrophosphoryl-undecaprenol N-acetylglucosamine transferase
VKTVGLACGPTGGHLLPAGLIAEELEELEVQPVIYTTQNPLSRKLLPEDVPRTDLSVRPWAGAGLFGKLASLGSILAEYGRLRHRLRSLAGLVSLGGHTALPALLGARERSLPTFIQEQNTVPGRTNRLFVPWALEVFLGFPVRKFRQKAKSTVTGNPVRPAGSTDEDWFQQSPLLVVLGGSQGSRQLSEILAGATCDLLEEGWTIYYVRGGNGEDLSARKWASARSFRQVEFEPQLHCILPEADCVWSRAGAGTLSELIQYEIPAVLFPYPLAADDHQRCNAQWVCRHGPARVLSSEDPPCTKDLVDATEALCSDGTSYDVPWDREVLPQKRIARRIKKWM